MAASEGSTLTRVFVVDASDGGVGAVGTSAAAVITADEDNRLIKVRERPAKKTFVCFCQAGMGDEGGGGSYA